MMTTILRFLAVLALGTWVGSTIFLMFFVAPDAFRLMPTRDFAGAIVGLSLTRLHLMGMVAALIFLVCHTWLIKRPEALIRPAALLVLLMVILTAASQYGVTPRMADLRQEMVAEHGSVDGTPRTHPLRLAFGRLHAVSATMEMTILLLGLIALFILVRRIGLP
jgi:hypothetical protein